MASLEYFVYFALFFGNMCFHPLKQGNSKDLSLIPSRWEKDEDPQDEGGKALHVHAYPHSIPRRGALAVATARLEPSVIARQTWSDPARRSGPRLAFHRPQTVQQHLRLPALNQMTLFKST